MTSIANTSGEAHEFINDNTNMVSLKFGAVQNGDITQEIKTKRSEVLILGAGRVCRPAADFLASIGKNTSQRWLKSCMTSDRTEFDEQNRVHVTVASLYLKDAEEVYFCLIMRSFSLS